MFRWIKPLLVLCAPCSCASYGQVAVISGQVVNTNGQPLPNGRVRVCSVTSTETPCTPTVPIFVDYGLTIPAPNPFQADQYGNYVLFAPGLPYPNLYTVQISPASGINWSYVKNGPFLVSIFIPFSLPG